MSRIGKLPITVPNNVTVTQENGQVTVKGSKGELHLAIPHGVTVTLEEGTMTVTRLNDERQNRALHGLIRSLLANMVIGVTTGFQKRLEVNGVGYRFQVQGKKLVLSLGYSHPIEYMPLDGVELKADEEKKNILVVSGIDKQKVGAVAAKIRSFRKPEPYKGKGIKYENEVIKRKAGKAAAKA